MAAFPTLELDELIAFTRVVQTQSFSQAGRDLGLPKSSVSRKVTELETRVGARLLQRTTRSVSLTDLGRTFYEHAVRIVAALEEAEQALARQTATPQGLFRVSVPVGFWFLGPIVAEFLRRYPDVRIELVCTDRRVDLVEERFDLALRAGPVADSSTIGRKLGSVRRKLVASHTLQKSLARLRDVSDLALHPCLAFAPEGETFELEAGPKRTSVRLEPRLTVNDYEMLHTVVRAGFGVALLPEFLCAEGLRNGSLIAVLPEWSAPEVPVHALYPSLRHVPPTVLAFLSLLRDKLHLDRIDCSESRNGASQKPSVVKRSRHAHGDERRKTKP